MKTRYVWHFHHDRLFELLLAPMACRRTGIRQTKEPTERRIRLGLFQLVKAQKALEQGLSRCQILALHRKECPDCPWSEKLQTIFTHRVRPKDTSLGRWCRPSEGRRVSQWND